MSIPPLPFPGCQSTSFTSVAIAVAGRLIGNKGVADAMSDITRDYPRFRRDVLSVGDAGQLPSSPCR